MSNPPPRPALRRAPDAGMSPAAVVVTSSPDALDADDSLAAAPAAKAAKELGRKKGRAKGKAKSKANNERKRATDVAVPARPRKSDDVDITFTVPKRLRKQLDARATELGHTREETLTMLVQAWLEG